MATAAEKRLAVRSKYDIIIGRNLYSQDRRNYCFKKYSNGKYYSDCSSSVSYCYQEAGYGFGILNTVGMYGSSKLKQVDVSISGGVPTDMSKLRIGDMFLFAGKDESRAKSAYVGHVEMVYSLGDTAATSYLCGHGSGNPAKHNMSTYCKSRQNAKTSTKRGNKGLIKVVRFIQDDGLSPDPAPDPVPVGKRVVTTGSVNLRYGPGTEYGVYKAVKNGTVLEKAEAGKWLPIVYKGYARWISSVYVDNGKTTGSVNIRKGPETSFASVDAVGKGAKITLAEVGIWIPVVYDKSTVLWVSGRYAKEE